ncbi:MAG: DUF4430 domain-containing protein [Clostridiaceae bacterium]|nr:DUF4430 domain-containing protein [Clostridiaceae bacterium]
MLCLIVVSFFIGGNHEVVPLSQEQMGYGLEESVVEEDKVKAESKDNAVSNKDNKDVHIAEEIKEVDNLGEMEEIKETKEIEIKNKTEEKSNAVEKNKIEVEKEKKKIKEEIIEEDKENLDKKDKYLTDPVPEGKPNPVEWQDVEINKENQLTATLSVTCKTILNNMEIFNKDKLEVLPEDGIIYPKQEVIFYEGESVFDVLLREMQSNRIHMEFSMTPIYNSNYVEGINNIYEFDGGELSGWMYKVNGWFPNYGSSRYKLENGDVIQWIYTCDLGRDIGGDWAVTGGGE